MSDHVWRQIARLLSGATTRAVLIAPFIKAPIFQSALAAIPRPVTDILCVTRWSAVEIAAGVSDPEILDIAQHDGRPSILLCHDLHAKLYLSDTRCLVGSANLTGKATGRFQPANIELLIEVDASHPEVQALLSRLLAESIPATSQLAASIRQQADLLAASDLAPISVESRNADAPARWYPVTRAPEHLYRIYLGNTGGCSRAFLDGALTDLVHLDLPPGLDKRQFNEAVLTRLYTFQEVASLLNDGRLSSADLEEALQGRSSSPVEAAERALTITRWLTYFDRDLHTVPTGAYEIVRGRQVL